MNFAVRDNFQMDLHNLGSISFQLASKQERQQVLSMVCLSVYGGQAARTVAVNAKNLNGRWCQQK